MIRVCIKMVAFAGGITVFTVVFILAECSFCVFAPADHNQSLTLGFGAALIELFMENFAQGCKNLFYGFLHFINI